MSHGRWWLVLFCFFWTIAAEAQSTDRKLTLNDAISAGIANSKLLKSSGEKIAIAQEKLGENNTQYYPRFNVSSSYSRLSNNITPFTVKFPGAPSAIALNPQILNQYGENAGSTELIYSGGKVRNIAFGNVSLTIPSMRITRFIFYKRPQKYCSKMRFCYKQESTICKIWNSLVQPCTTTS